MENPSVRFGYCLDNKIAIECGAQLCRFKIEVFLGDLVDWYKLESDLRTHWKLSCPDKED